MAFTEPWPAPTPPKRLDLSSPLPGKGVRVPLKVAFSGTPIAAVVLSNNSLSPLLRFYDDAVETRVIRKVKHRYTDITLADADATLLSDTPSMLKLMWKGGLLHFLGRPTQADDLVAVFQFLAGKGVPLGPAARALLDADGTP